MKRSSSNSCVSTQLNDCFELAESSLGSSNHGSNSEDSPPLSGSSVESRQSPGQDGVFKSLRRRLTTISRQSSKSVSAVVPFNSGSEDEKEKNHISVVQKARAPHYRCVPLPPGFIPSEVLMILDHQDQSVYSTEAGNVAAAIRSEKVGNQSPAETTEDNVNSNTSISSGLHKVKKGVLYNNWVDPKF